MNSTLSPARLRLATSAPVRRVNGAVAAVRSMPIEELRSELEARRTVDTATRAARQREGVKKRAKTAADRLRSL